MCKSAHKYDASLLKEASTTVIPLPKPILKSQTSIEEALLKRRSVRDYKKDSLQLSEIAQLLWAAQGITDKDGGRTAPSAGALYPLEVYVLAEKVKDLAAGVYHYQPVTHSLTLVNAGGKATMLTAAAIMQQAIHKGAAILVITAIYSRTTVKYGNRGKQYVHMEAGHAAQNVYLQAVSLNLGTVVMGAFNETLVRNILHLPEDEVPLYLMPVGKM